jgi:hypothetical protein
VWAREDVRDFVLAHTAKGERRSRIAEQLWEEFGIAATKNMVCGFLDREPAGRAACRIAAERREAGRKAKTAAALSTEDTMRALQERYIDIFPYLDTRRPEEIALERAREMRPQTREGWDGLRHVEIRNTQYRIFPIG